MIWLYFIKGEGLPSNTDDKNYAKIDKNQEK